MESADDFFRSLKAQASPVTDTDGKPIPEFAGLLIRPLDVNDMMKVGEWVEANGQTRAYQIVFVRGLRKADGTQLIPDERAGELAECINGPIKKVVDRIRQVSGMMDAEESEPNEEKKMSLTNGKI